MCSLEDNSSEGDVIWLGNNESNLLLTFIIRKDKPTSKEQLLDLVWESNGFHVDESSVIQSISLLRKILNDSAKTPDFIKTIPKHGYQLISEVISIAPQPIDINECDDSEVEEPLLESESNSQHQTMNRRSLLSLVGASSKKVRFTFRVIILIFIPVFSFYYLYISNEPDLEQVGNIEEIPVQVISGQSMEVGRGAYINQCINHFIQGPHKEIERIIVSINPMKSITFNIINRDYMLNKTIVLMSDIDELPSLCSQEVSL